MLQFAVAMSLVIGTGASPARAPVVRALDPQLRADLRDAVNRSPTLQAILRELERSDLIVHLVRNRPHAESGVASGGSRGALRFVGATGGRRFVRIAISGWRSRHAQAALLAHELYHALEVAREPGVIDEETFGDLYAAIGRSVCQDPSRRCFDTDGAQSVELLVLNEYRRRRTP